MHVKVIIHIVVCCQFDMHFSPHFEIFRQSGHGSKSCRAPSVHFKGFTASDSGSTAKCRVPACILRPADLFKNTILYKNNAISHYVVSISNKRVDAQTKEV